MANNKNKADAYRHEEERLEIYGYEQDNMTKQKKYRITVKDMRAGYIACVRVRLTEPSKLILPNAGVIYDENTVYEVLAIGKSPEDPISLEVGDLFISSNSGQGYTMPHTVMSFNGVDRMAYEIVQTFNVICKVDYEKIEVAPIALK